MEIKHAFQKNRVYRTFWLQILFLLSGALMIAHALRMIYQGVFHPETAYMPNTFDLFFDWTTLSILGVIVCISTVFTIYHMLQNKKKQSSNERVLIADYHPT